MENQFNISDLQQWWDELSFPGKDLFKLKENGDLVLLHDENQERVIAALTPVNADVVMKALRANFKEAEEKVNNLQREWVAAEDKLKLATKVARIKEYLLRANAVGEVDRLFKEIYDHEHTISELAEENLKAKNALADLAESLAESDNKKETTEAFRDIVSKWKQLGFYDKQKDDEIWKRIETARQKFHERNRINQQELEKEWMQNLDLKMEIVEKAESLANSDEWKKTHEVFKELMEKWKATGRTIPEKNEELWKRFMAAKNAFYDRRKAHGEFVHTELESNYALKLALVEKAEGMKDSTSWSSTARAYNELMEDWKHIGRVPQEKSDEIWNRLLAAKKHFFDAKHAHDKEMRSTMSQNHEQRLALVERAEQAKLLTNWNEGTQIMNELLDEWKKIGHLRRENTDAIWEQFIAARKYFFERKEAYWAGRKSQTERHKNDRIQHKQASLRRLEDEIREEEEKIADFKNGLENITPGKKAEELRTHLNNLIREGEENIARMRQKLDGSNKERKGKNQEGRESEEEQEPQQTEEN